MIASLPSLPAFHSIPSSSSAGASTSYARHTAASTSSGTHDKMGSHRPFLPSMDVNSSRSLPYYQPRQNHRQDRSSTSPTPSSQSSRSGDDAAVAASNGNGSAHPLYARPSGAINTQDSQAGALTATGSGRKRKRLQRVSYTAATCILVTST